jgi:hypothetical protein
MKAIIKFTASTLIGVLIGAGAVAAQSAKSSVAPPPTPATKLEKFQSRTGVTIIKGFSKEAEIPTQYGGLLTVEAMELQDAAMPTSREIGIVVTTKGGESYSSERRSFIDADEIDSLLQGIDYISHSGGIAKFHNFEAIYDTKGGLKVTVFNSHIGEEKQAAVECGSIGSEPVFITLANLQYFRSAIASAKEQLYSNKSSDSK